MRSTSTWCRSRRHRSVVVNGNGDIKVAIGAVVMVMVTAGIAATREDEFE